MKPLYRGLLVALVQCTLVLSMTAKYQWDRDRLPRVWAKVGPVDPNAPIRGRYLQLRLEVEMDSAAGSAPERVRLYVRDGRLMAKVDPSGALRVWNLRSEKDTSAFLQEPVSFFLSDTAKDPSRLQPGEELWAEVSVPPDSLPRPIRLGIKKDGSLTALDLR